MQKNIILCCVLYLSFVANSIAAPKPKHVETIRVEPTVVTKSIRLLGTVKAKREARLLAPVQGVVEEILVQEGESVKKDQLLIIFQNEDLRKQYDLAVANEDLANKVYERFERIHQQGQLSSQKLDESRQSKLSAEMATYRAKQALDKSLVKAPFDGVCGSFKVSEGAYTSVNDRIVDVYDSTQLEVIFGVPQWVLPKVFQGQPVKVNGIEGEISFVDRAIDVKTHMGQARAKIKFNALHIGAVAQVDIITDQIINVLALPHTAIFLQKGEPHAYVVRDGKAAEVKLRTGLSGDSLMEVVEGLDQGEVVVSRGYTALWSGMPVYTEMDLTKE